MQGNKQLLLKNKQTNKQAKFDTTTTKLSEEWSLTKIIHGVGLGGGTGWGEKSQTCTSNFLWSICRLTTTCLEGFTERWWQNS